MNANEIKARQIYLTDGADFGIAPERIKVTGFVDVLENGELWCKVAYLADGLKAIWHPSRIRPF